MNSLVLLAGCGLGDGSCIEEVILTYLALENTIAPISPSLSPCLSRPSTTVRRMWEPCGMC